MEHSIVDVGTLHKFALMLYLVSQVPTFLVPIVMVSQMPCGTSFGFRGTLTGGLILVVWHVAHPLMYAFTNVVIPGHQKSLVIM
jgi:hypothetical protein